MQCPRCTEEIAGQSTECPVCHKRLSPCSPANVRVALTGEAYELSNTNVTRHQSTVMAPPIPVDRDKISDPLPVRIIPTKPDLFPTARRTPLPQVKRSPGLDPRWMIVLFAIIGVIASAVLFHHPYVAPVYVTVQTTGPGELALNAGGERPIPAVYLWLWGAYCVLAVATQIFLPAPWRFGPLQWRTNWVLNITTIVTMLLFIGAGSVQQAEGALGQEALNYTQNGTYQYRNGNETRDVTAEEAQQINAHMIQSQEAAIFKQWNLAALLAFLALGGYAAWWIVERPVADSVTPAPDPTWLVRIARGESKPSNTIDDVETFPSENARPRDSASGDISWR